jgi:hypothetical protein
MQHSETGESGEDKADENEGALHADPSHGRVGYAAVTTS